MLDMQMCMVRQLALARAVGAHAPSLCRLLRVLASVGIFSEVGERPFALTPPKRRQLAESGLAARCEAIAGDRPARPCRCSRRSREMERLADQADVTPMRVSFVVARRFIRSEWEWSAASRRPT
jgi:hypothetical protein